MTGSPRFDSNGSHHPIPADEEDIDAVLASLEDEDDSKYQSHRAQELSANLALSREANTSSKVDEPYVTLRSNDEVLHFTTEHHRAVVHFFHPDFARCSIMDDHARLIASKHSEHREADLSFARVNVKDANFVVEKLSIRVLPCVIGFVKGVVKGRVTGFEGICWDGNESSIIVARALEQTLHNWEVLKHILLSGAENDDSTDDDDRPSQARSKDRRGIKSGQHNIKDAEDDDWD